MTNLEWIDPSPEPAPSEMQEAIGGHPLVSSTLDRRGFSDTKSALSFINPNLYQPASPQDLPGMESAVSHLVEAIHKRERICVWGDFDVDGQTATALLVSTLKVLGADVIYHVPVRASESHGVNLENLEICVRQGANILLTCDTGITSHVETEYARNNKIKVIITDHHDLPDVLPVADAIVNPKLLPQNHSLSTLPGVGVAYKLAQAIVDYQALSPNIYESQLDLVALGIVSDLAQLKGDTRYLLQKGLECLHQTNRLGLKKLMENVGLMSEAYLSEEHIGFVIGPRLNALGRLGDANRGVEFLTTGDKNRAEIIALELEELNAQRQFLTNQVFQGAMQQIERDPGIRDAPVIVLCHPEWPAGVIGIVANKLVEHFKKPVVLISNPPGEIARGSARSIEGVNITQAITAAKTLLHSYGGHPMAAGMALTSENIPKFRRLLCESVQKVTKKLPQPKLHLDGYVNLSDLSLDFVMDLERLAPFGVGNPALILATRNLALTGYLAVGRDAEHLLLTIEDNNGYTQKVIWWHGAGWPLPEQKFDLAYTVRSSSFKGQREIQVEWINYRLIEANDISLPSSSALQVIDYRLVESPLDVLSKVISEGEVIVWGEGEALKSNKEQGVNCLDRHQLSPAKNLVIWTIPPSHAILKSALDTVKPRQVYLFSAHPGMDTLKLFLEILNGLINFTVKVYHGNLNVNQLAAATAQEVETVNYGLQWFERKGYIQLTRIKDDEFSIKKLDHISEGEPSATHQVTRILRARLRESAEYRKFYINANKNSLVNLV